MKAGRAKKGGEVPGGRPAGIDSTRRELGGVGERFHALASQLTSLAEGARRPLEVKLRLAAATLREAASGVEETLRHLEHSLALESLAEFPAEPESLAPPAKKKRKRTPEPEPEPESEPEPEPEPEPREEPSPELADSLTLEHAMEHLADLPESPEEGEEGAGEPEETTATPSRKRRRGGRKRKSGRGKGESASSADQGAFALESPAAESAEAAAPEAGGDTPSGRKRSSRRRRGGRKRGGAGKEGAPQGGESSSGG